MVRDIEDPSGSRGPSQLPLGHKTFWRSASWSSRSPTSEHANDFDTTSNQFGCFPVPLTPRSSQNKARSSLPPLQPLSITRRNYDEWPKAGSDDVGEWLHPATPSGSSSKQLNLDLPNFQKSQDIPDISLMKDKMAFSNKECSKVAEHIYLGGNAVARDRDILRQHGITHVLNCVGYTCPDYFKADLVYKTLWLQDTPSEDITSILYDVFDYFEDVRQQQGRVLVHCCQGVSRSTALVIAYLMWREGQSFDDAFKYVKSARRIANPNMGFACQLLQCQKRVHAIPLSPNSVVRMFRMAPHSLCDPLHLVPKLLNEPSPFALDSRGAFIILIPSAVYIWVGINCESVMERDAKAAAFQVVRYEKIEGSIVTIKEGEEPSDFWGIFTSFPVNMDTSEESMGVRKELVYAAGNVAKGNKKVVQYDADFELFHKALVVSPSLRGCGQGVVNSVGESSWSLLRRKFVSGGLKEWLQASTSAPCRLHSNSLLAGDLENDACKLLTCSTISEPSVQAKSSSVSSQRASEHLLPPASVSSSGPAPDNQSHLNASSPDVIFVTSSSEHHACPLKSYIGNSVNSVTGSNPSLFLSSLLEAGSSDNFKSMINGEEIDVEKNSIRNVSKFSTVGQLNGGGSVSIASAFKFNHNFSEVRQPLVYQWPNLKVVKEFVLDDLHSRAVFVFLASFTDTFGHESRKLYLWIGRHCRHTNRYKQVPSSARVEEVGWHNVGLDILVWMALPTDIPVEVINEENEKSEEFIQLLGCFPAKRR